MFDEPGIGVDDLAWIDRDQFIYYLEVEHQLADPTDWPRFRHRLLGALTAAFALDTIWVNHDAHHRHRQITARHRRALQLLDQARARHDPTSDWHGFLDALWHARHALWDSSDDGEPDPSHRAAPVGSAAPHQ